MKAKLIKVVGFILMFISFYYIYFSLIKAEINWHELMNLLNEKNIILISISLLLYLFVLSISSAYWSYLLQSFSEIKHSKRSELMAVYAKSNIGKYLPGNFMQFVGRNLLANNLGYKHSNIILSTIYDMIYVVISGVLLLLFLSAFRLSNISLSNILSIPKDIYLITAVIIIILTPIILLLFKTQIIKFFQKNQIITRVKNSLWSGISLYLIVFLILGLANLLLLSLFSSEFTMNNYYNILFVFIISWLIGFIVPGAPGGIGIREAIFIYLLSQNYQIVVVTMIPILFRIISIIGDLIFFVLNLRKIKS